MAELKIGPAGFPCVGMERTTRFLCEAQLLNVLADGLPGVVAYIDRSGLCRFINGMSVSWLSRTQGDCLGADVSEIFGTFAPALAVELKRAMAGSHIEFEAEADFAHGLVNVVRGYLYPDRDHHGDVQGAFVLLLDITRERSFERELKIARDEAIEANRSKSRFLAAASHDLRQPLQAMTLFVSALTRRVQEGEAKQLVRNVDTSLRSLRSMIDALLDLSKLESGLVTPAKSIFRVQELLDTIAPGLAAQARDRGLKLRIRPSSALIEADRALLETSVRNLVANALKFTGAGGILIGVRRHAERTGIVVADTGIGIEPERVAEVFQEFKRGRATASGANDGIGLGLSIVQRLVGLHGGKVTVRSRAGRGSVFTLWLPSLKEARRPAGGSRGNEAAISIANRRLMVIDDDVSCAEALQREFEDQGANVTMANCIEDAERAIADAGVPEAMIVDYNLGGRLTGLQFVQNLRRVRSEARAVLVTGSTDSQTLAELKASGIPWLTKPVDPTVLRDTVLSTMSR
jgi:signal transduction histidine kinase